eukprot:m.1640705 g.1640705  ORF g.1640705 m.1640705 type:complete len:80 (+) comp43561_c0_seq1:21-260(+)
MPSLAFSTNEASRKLVVSLQYYSFQRCVACLQCQSHTLSICREKHFNRPALPVPNESTGITVVAATQWCSGTSDKKPHH